MVVKIIAQAWELRDFSQSASRPSQSNTCSTVHCTCLAHGHADLCDALSGSGCFGQPASVSRSGAAVIRTPNPEIDTRKFLPRQQITLFSAPSSPNRGKTTSHVVCLEDLNSFPCNNQERPAQSSHGVSVFWLPTHTAGAYSTNGCTTSIL